jgi:polar amino acid transport system substrate-binding protein
VTVTEERKARLSFSTPYFPNRVMVVQKTASGFAQPGDLKDRRVAVVKGTLSTSLVSSIPGVKSVLVDDDDAAFQALLKGSADALACDSAVVLHYLTLNPELGIAFPLGERSFFAFALPPGSKLLGPLNDHLKALARSGAFTKLLAKHFGEANAEFLADDVAKAGAKP